MPHRFAIILELRIDQPAEKLALEAVGKAGARLIEDLHRVVPAVHGRRGPAPAGSRPIRVSGPHDAFSKSSAASGSFLSDWAMHAQVEPGLRMDRVIPHHGLELFGRVGPVLRIEVEDGQFFAERGPQKRACPADSAASLL